MVRIFFRVLRNWKRWRRWSWGSAFNKSITLSLSSLLHQQKAIHWRMLGMITYIHKIHDELSEICNHMTDKMAADAVTQKYLKLKGC